MPLPTEVTQALAPGDPGGVAILGEQALTGSTGTATGEVVLLEIQVPSADGRTERRRLIRKTLSPTRAGRHAAGADDPSHWAYWRREAEAYRSDLLPTGPGLRAPRCWGVVDDVIYLEMVDGPRPSTRRAAEHLAVWQSGAQSESDRPWLAGDQIGQRLSVTELDWSGLDVDPGFVQLWNRRGELQQELARLPRVLSHGDYSVANLFDAEGDTVAIDWATLGLEPVGFDLAHLALSTGEDPTRSYLAASTRFDPPDVIAGYRSALSIIGTSRLHWMLSGGHEVPPWYPALILGVAAGGGR